MSKVFHLIKQIFRSKSSNDKFVQFIGTDRFNNKFYERLPENRHYNAARRYYEPSDYENVRLRIDPSWEAWLRGTRKNPPTLDETIAQENKRQQLAEKPTTMLPTSYGTESAQGGTTSFPIRNNLEMNPGMKSREKSNQEETF